MLALINLDEYFIEEFIVKLNPSFNPEEPTKGDIFVDFDMLKNDKNDHLFKISMTIELNKNKENSPYYIFFKINGFFSYDKTASEEYIQKTIAQNAPSILYGVARGIIAQITSNYEFGKFILPSVNFIEILKRKLDIEDKKKEKKKKNNK